MKKSASHQGDSSPVYVCFCPWRWLLGITLLSALIAFVDSEIGWQAVYDQWQGVNVGTLALAFLLFIVSHILRAYRIHLLLACTFNTSLLAVSKLSAWHQAANNILPMRIGEFVLPLLFNRYFGMKWSSGISRLVWLRLFDLIFMGLVTLMVLALYSLNLAAMLALIGLLALIVGLLCIKLLIRVAFVGRLLGSLRKTAPCSALAYAHLLLVTVAAWTCKLSAIALVISAVSSLSLTTALSGALGAEITSLLPIHGLAGAGTYEAGFVALAQLFTDATAVLIAASVNVHIFVLLSTCTLALVLSPISMSRYTTVESN